MRDRQSELVALLESAGPSLHRLLTRLTLRPDVAEDLMQELFVNLAQSEAFTRAADPAGYAHRAAMNLAFAWRRAQQRTRMMPGALRPPVPSSDRPLAKLEADDEVRRVLDAMNDLPDLQREALTMRYIEQAGYETVAAMLGRTPSQARALCHKAIGSLRRLFSEDIATPNREGSPHVER